MRFLLYIIYIPFCTPSHYLIVYILVYHWPRPLPMVVLFGFGIQHIVFFKNRAISKYLYSLLLFFISTICQQQVSLNSLYLLQYKNRGKSILFNQLPSIVLGAILLQLLYSFNINHVVSRSLLAILLHTLYLLQWYLPCTVSL